MEENELRGILADSVTRILADHVTKEVLQDTEKGAWPEALWQQLEENGLTRVMVSGEAGGAEGTWEDAFVVLKAAGHYGAPVPLAETLVATWLLNSAGLDIPDGPLTLLTGDLQVDGDTLSGTAVRVPWGRDAAAGVAIAAGPDRPVLALVELDGAGITEELNVAREPRDTVMLKGAGAAIAPTNLAADTVTLLGAMARGAQMAGALDAALAQSVQYANERTQFGKPIGKFQAIQQQLALLSGHAAAAGTVAAHAAAQLAKACALGEGPEAARFEIACAKVRADEAAGQATSIAHQTHGAIGFTYEHGLHFVTRRLWSWRAEYGSGGTWAKWLGNEAMRVGADGLWPHVTAR